MSLDEASATKETKNVQNRSLSNGNSINCATNNDLVDAITSTSVELKGGKKETESLVMNKKEEKTAIPAKSHSNNSDTDQSIKRSPKKSKSESTSFSETMNNNETIRNPSSESSKLRSRSKRALSIGSALAPLSTTIVSSTQPNSSSSSSSADFEAPCTWCSDVKPLGYILPTMSGEREFCSEMCIFAFRDALKKGACTLCGNLIRENVAPNKLFCSTYCLNKHQMTKNGILHNNNGGLANKSVSNVGKRSSQRASFSDGVSSSSISISTNINNNNNNNNMMTKRNSPTHSLARSFQYESFSVFDWNDYLLVSIVQ